MKIVHMVNWDERGKQNIITIISGMALGLFHCSFCLFVGRPWRLYPCICIDTIVTGFGFPNVLTILTVCIALLISVIPISSLVKV
jgi:hypothetical protein